jgi:hypothetical protein
VGAPRADRVRGTGCVDMPATALYHRGEARMGEERLLLRKATSYGVASHKEG